MSLFLTKAALFLYTVLWATYFVLVAADRAK